MWHEPFRSCDGRARRGWTGFDADFSAFFGGGGPKRRGPFGSGRMFEQGDLKLVILRLLDEKPRHGYDIIKELEERSGGRYTPSAGAIYPTLTMLEDLGYAVTTPEEGGKKVYSITDAGRAHLAEHRPVVDELFERVNHIGDAVFGDGVRPARDAMIGLAKEFGAAMMNGKRSPEQVAAITDILERAAAELRRAAS
ncbi:MAG: PadR family transcriptional regulator [Gemmatimonadaceae bacterium]|nr:PadR family transcriptional regulator [Gemmatimonadaceae bacterium]